MCFSKLVVSEDAVLRFLYERVVEMKDPAYVAYRADWFRRFQKHLFALEKLHATVRKAAGKHVISRSGVLRGSES